MPNQTTSDNKSYYEVKINLQDSIKTDTGQTIPYKPNMTANISDHHRRKNDIRQNI